MQTQGCFLCFIHLYIDAQRIQIDGIRKDPWFRRNYVAVRHGEDEDVNLDDVHAVFYDIEVDYMPFCAFYCYRLSHSCLKKINLYAQFQIPVLLQFALSPIDIMVNR